MKYRKRKESDEQIAVANYLRIKYSDILFTISPEGMRLTIGQAVKFKKMGYRRGTPDLMIFEPRQGHHQTSPPTLTHR